MFLFKPSQLLLHISLRFCCATRAFVRKQEGVIARGFISSKLLLCFSWACGCWRFGHHIVVIHVLMSAASTAPTVSVTKKKSTMFVKVWWKRLTEDYCHWSWVYSCWACFYTAIGSCFAASATDGEYSYQSSAAMDLSEPIPLIWVSWRFKEELLVVGMAKLESFLPCLKRYWGSSAEQRCWAFASAVLASFMNRCFYDMQDQSWWPRMILECLLSEC